MAEDCPWRCRFERLLSGKCQHSEWFPRLHAIATYFVHTSTLFQSWVCAKCLESRVELNEPSTDFLEQVDLSVLLCQL